MNRRQLLALACATSGLGLWGPQVMASTSKPLRLVVGFPAGTAPDAITRIIAEVLSKQLNQPVIVDNKPGADGIIAASEVLRAPPDGQTLFMGTNTTMVAVPSTRPNPPFDPFRDFAPLSSAGEFSYFLMVSPSLPVKNAHELLRLIEANPGKYNSASSNSAAELGMLRLLDQRKVVNVRYKGDPAAMTDLTGGSVHMMFTTGTLAPAFVKDGRARALLTLQAERSPLLPEVPTAKELGVDNLTIRPWAGFFGPAALPAPAARKLSNALQTALANESVRSRLAQHGFSGYGMSIEQFTAFFREQYDGFNAVIKKHNIKFE